MTDPNSPLTLALNHYRNGDYQAAEAMCLEILEQDPESLTALHILGKVAYRVGNQDLAIELLAEVEMDPDPKEFPLLATLEDWNDTYEICKDLASICVNQVQLERATIFYEKAINLQPSNAKNHYNYAVVLYKLGRYKLTLLMLEKAEKLDSNLLIAKVYSNLFLPSLYESQVEMDHYWNHYKNGLSKLKQSLLLDLSESSDNVLSVLTIANNFYLAYQGKDIKSLQFEYGSLIYDIMKTSYPDLSNPLTIKSLANGRKYRIGYISRYFRSHTVGKLLHGWIKQANKDKFEIYSYFVGKEEESDHLTEIIKSYSDVFRIGFDHIIMLLQQIIQDNLDILVFTDIGMDPHTGMLAALRLAPIQCSSWGHPVTSGLPTIDYFLSSDLMEPENAQDHYTEKLIRLPNIGISYSLPTVPSQPLPRTEQLREGTIIYLSCQSLFKYLPQHDDVFARIAQEVPNAQFIFLANPHVPIHLFWNRLGKAFTDLDLDVNHSCKILPQMNHEGYLRLNLASDIYLDTLEWSGGNTTLEAIACGLPIVTCPGKFMRGRHSYAILRQMQIDETIASDKEDYIRIAIRLGLDPEWRQRIRELMRQRHHLLYDDLAGIRGLEAFYEEAIAEQWLRQQA